MVKTASNLRVRDQIMAYGTAVVRTKAELLDRVMYRRSMIEQWVWGGLSESGKGLLLG